MKNFRGLALSLIVLMVVSVVLALFILVGSAGAQTPVPTATPSPTPVFDCPEPGVITDTEQLDPEWAVNCAFCFVTPTATSIYQVAEQTPISTYAIGTPLVTGTPGCVFQEGEWFCPTATVSPTVTPTPSPTPTSAPTFEYYTKEFDLTAWGKGVNENDVVRVFQDSIPIGSKLVAVAWVGASASPPPSNIKWGTGTSGYNPSPVYLGGGSEQATNYCTYSDSYGGTNPCQWLSTEYPVAWAGVTYRPTSGWHNILAGNDINTVFACSNWYNQAASCQITPIFIYYGVPPTPAPTPTPEVTGSPTPEGVDCSEPVYRDSEPAITVTGTEYLGTTCPLDLPEISLEIPEFMGVGGVVFELPATSICIDWYAFPTMEIFEVTFSAAVAFFPLIIFAIIFIMRI